MIWSSITMHGADTAALAGDRARTTRWLAATIALGAAFLMGQACEYTQLGFEVSDHSYGTLFYSMTGFHGLHVLGGLAALTLVLIKNTRGEISSARHGPVKAVSYYWHFMDAVWILLFATLYLLR